MSKGKQLVLLPFLLPWRILQHGLTLTHSNLIIEGDLCCLYTRHVRHTRQTGETNLHINVSQTLHYFPSEKVRPETWPGKAMGKATPVRQLTLSHRCHHL